MNIRTMKEIAVRTGSVAAAAALLGGSFVAQLATAQESGRVTVDVEQCLELESAAARGACFAAQVDQALDDRSSSDASDGSAATRSDADRDRAAAAQRTTQPAPRAAARPFDRARDADEEIEYFGKIVELRETVPNSYVITLDNGQVWRQTDPQRYPLRTGLDVRLEPTRWGSQYRLTSEATGGYIRVKLAQ